MFAQRELHFSKLALLQQVGKNKQKIVFSIKIINIFFICSFRTMRWESSAWMSSQGKML